MGHADRPSVSAKRDVKIRFTKHAREKLKLLRAYGIYVDEDVVIYTVKNSFRVDRRRAQLLAIKPMNDEHALGAFYEVRNDYYSGHNALSREEGRIWSMRYVTTPMPMSCP